MPAPIPATFVANQVVTEADMNKISDGLRNAAAITLMTPNQIPYLQSAGQLAGIPAPPGAGTYELVCVNGVFRWQTPAPATPPSNSVGSAQIQSGAVGESELAANAVHERNVDIRRGPPQSNEVIAWNGNQFEWRLARMKQDILDTDNSGSTRNTTQTWTESSGVGDHEKYIFVFVRIWYNDSGSRFVQSPMISFHNLPSGQTDTVTCDFRIGGISQGSSRDSISMNCRMWLDRSENRYGFEVQATAGSAYVNVNRVDLFGINRFVAGSGF